MDGRSYAWVEELEDSSTVLAISMRIPCTALAGPLCDGTASQVDDAAPPELLERGDVLCARGRLENICAQYQKGTRTRGRALFDPTCDGTRVPGKQPLESGTERRLEGLLPSLT